MVETRFSLIRTQSLSIPNIFTQNSQREKFQQQRTYALSRSAVGISTPFHKLLHRQRWGGSQSLPKISIKCVNYIKFKRSVQHCRWSNFDKNWQEDWVESDSVCNHTSGYKIAGVRFVNHGYDYRSDRGSPICKSRVWLQIGIGRHEVHLPIEF